MIKHFNYKHGLYSKINKCSCEKTISPLAKHRS